MDWARAGAAQLDRAQQARAAGALLGLGEGGRGAARRSAAGSLRPATPLATVDVWHDVDVWHGMERSDLAFVGVRIARVWGSAS